MTLFEQIRAAAGISTSCRLIMNVGVLHQPGDVFSQPVLFYGADVWDDALSKKQTEGVVLGIAFVFYLLQRLSLTGGVTG